MPVISILCYSAYQFFVRSYNMLKIKKINVNIFFICEVYNTFCEKYFVFSHIYIIFATKLKINEL